MTTIGGWSHGLRTTQPTVSVRPHKDADPVIMPVEPRPTVPALEKEIETEFFAPPQDAQPKPKRRRKGK